MFRWAVYNERDSGFRVIFVEQSNNACLLLVPENHVSVSKEDAANEVVYVQRFSNTPTKRLKIVAIKPQPIRIIFQTRGSKVAWSWYRVSVTEQVREGFVFSAQLVQFLRMRRSIMRLGPVTLPGRHLAGAKVCDRVPVKTQTLWVGFGQKATCMVEVF